MRRSVALVLIEIAIVLMGIALAALAVSLLVRWVHTDLAEFLSVWPP
jgi:hypothetical protein